MFSRRTLIIALLVVVGLGTGIAYWMRKDGERSEGYVSEAVERGAIAATVTATGIVNPVTTVQVGTYVSGPIQAIYADFNARVKKGQRVAKIDPAPFQVKVQKAEASLATARARVDKDKADLDFKKLTLDRNQELHSKNLISQNDVDTARSNYDQAKAQLALDVAGVEQAQADLDDARINLAYTDITSPVEGVVVSRNVDVGQTVAASFQTPTLFLIAQDLARMQVDTSVSESDVGDVREGQHAIFTVDAYPGKEFQGTVAQARNAPTTVQNVVTYDVVVTVDNAELELKPGMTANVRITTAQRDDAIKIPVRALRFNPNAKAGATDGTRPSSGHDKQPVVWAVQPDGTLRKVPVKVGIRNEQYAELLSGDVKVGDQLAVALRRTQSSDANRPRPPGGPRFR